MAILPNGGRPRSRADWIASLAGFWRAVADAQTALGLPHRRDPVTHQPLLRWFAPWMRERVRRRESTPELFGDGDRDGAFYRAAVESILARVELRYGLDDHGKWSRDHLTTATDAVRAAEDWLNVHHTLGLEPWALYREVLSLIERFGLAPADDGFVASCIYDSIECHLDARKDDRALLPVIQFTEHEIETVSASKASLWEHYFEVGRIYVDVTDAVDPVEEVRAVLPDIERCRARLAFDPPGVVGPGRPPKAMIAAYAELLKDEERDRTWKQVAKLVNARLETDYDGDQLGELVRVHRKKGAPSRP